MKIQQIRNATVKIEYGGTTFLVDPMLGKKGSFAPFPLSNDRRKNPLYDLPCSIDEIISGVDAVIITHLHTDHVDETAFEVLPKQLKIFVQNKADQKVFHSKGFADVEILNELTQYRGITLSKTRCQHGKIPMLLFAGHVCGVVFSCTNEKTLYLTGDTIWYKRVQETIKKHNPDVILLNAGGNKFGVFRPVIMHQPDVLQVHLACPNATLIASHMEGVNHNTVTRTALRQFAVENGFSDKLFIPADGETIPLP